MLQHKLLAFALFLAQMAFAQTRSIQIELYENVKTPIIEDSTKTLFGITDKVGQVKFETSLGKQYLMEATYTGMAPLQKGLKVVSSTTVYRFAMVEDATALKAVTIKAKKPLMRQEEDKTIVDPEPIANTSTSAYEIMEKIPGLFLDQDGNVYLNSSTPATIYINGREQKMAVWSISS